MTVPFCPHPSSRGHIGRRGRRALVSIVAVASVALGALAIVGAGSGTVAASRTWYVAVDGDDGASGTSGDPFATIEHAVRRAESGDTIRIGAGRFHESVQVYEETLTLIGAGVGQTVLDGATIVTGFRNDTDGRFSAPW